MSENNLRNYNWKDRKPNYIRIEDLSEKQQQRLIHSDNFCMIPWIHLHGWPDGRAYPCCLGKGEHPVGNLKEQTMLEVWNADAMRELRNNMLADKPSKECTACYEQEAAGFSSSRHILFCYVDHTSCYQ